MRLTIWSGVVMALTALAFAPLLAQDSSHAVIIEGWQPIEAAGLDWVPDVGDTFNELWNDCFLWFEEMYNRAALAQDTSRIHMLWGVGQPWANLSPRYDPQGWLGLNRIVDDSATVNTVGNTFSGLESRMGSADSLYCYTWGHGGKDSAKTHYSIYVAPIVKQGIYYYGDTLWDTTFARMVNAVPGKRAFVMQQCNGGGFMDDLTDSNTVMVCAAAAGKSAYSADNDSKNGSPLPEHEIYQGQTYRHCEFNFHFMNALRGTAIWGNNGYGDPPVVDADVDGDGVVSWREAYDYTKYHDSKEDPVFFGEDSFWSVLPDVPTWPTAKKVNAGGALAAELSSTTLIYALKGNNTRDFYAYDPAKDSWLERDTIPSSGSTGARKVSSGATLVSVGNGKLYATKGRCLQFWKYDDSVTAGPKWTEMPNVPAPTGKKPKDGASAVAVPYNDTTYVYLLKGANTLEFYRFNTARSEWDATSLAQPPIGTEKKKFKAGSCMAFDGYDTIYALKGTRNSATSYFPMYAYSVSGDSWVSKTGLPLTSSKKSLKGSSMAFCGEDLYAVKGSGLETWAYRRADAGWHKMQSMPTAPSNKKKVGPGSAAVSDGTVIWAFKGGNSRDFYRFMPNRCSGEPYDPPQPPSPGENEFCLAEDGDAEDERWSNSGEWVAYTVPTQDGRQVFKVSSSGGDPVQLTSLAGECARPVWSPGDTSIAFEFTPDSTGYSQIAVVPGDSGAVTFLTASSWDHWHATWSPAGLVAFLRDDSTNFPQVYAALSTGEAPLTQQSVEHESPEFVTPTLLIFTREDGYGYTQVYATPVGSQSESPITGLPTDHANPASGAGMVCFEMDDQAGFTQIGGVQIGSTTGEVYLTGGAADFESPTVNASGSAIFCTRSSGPGNAICQVNPMGGFNQLTDEAVERLTPHALPNGMTSVSVAYVRDGDVYKLIPGSGGGQQSSGQWALSLSGAEPNPARTHVSIRWAVPAEADVSLRVYNTAGQLVKVLANGRTKPGAYTSIWNGTDAKGRRLANGVYFYALDNGAKRISRKLVLTD